LKLYPVHLAPYPYLEPTLF